MNGVLIVDKPKGITSHDVVDIIRGGFKIEKVGHAGTLDPLATGLLVVLIGKATKLSNNLSGSDKEYEVSCLLGVKTDTDDLEGKIIKKQNQLNITKEDLEKALSKFKGKIKQKVPRYSAVKLKGKKLYELARKNKKFEAPVREVIIYDLDIIKFELPEVKLRVRCSKGAYMRSLSRDIGEVLGCGGCVSRLRRIISWPFSIDEAVKLKTLKNLDRPELEKLILPIKDNESLQRFIQSKKN